jgi:hypothetical protein
MKRREFIALVGGATVALPFTAGAQQGERVRRIGLLMAFAESDPAAQSQVAAFRGALAKLGWSEGNNLRIELRWGAGDELAVVPNKPTEVFARNLCVCDARSVRRFCRGLAQPRSLFVST